MLVGRIDHETGAEPWSPRGALTQRLYRQRAALLSKGLRPHGPVDRLKQSPCRRACLVCNCAHCRTPPTGIEAAEVERQLASDPLGGEWDAGVHERRLAFDRVTDEDVERAERDRLSGADDRFRQRPGRQRRARVR
jgi:hypothetical protein